MEKRQFYVSLVPNIGNPSFEHEPAYPTLKLPDAGYQLLALYRFWNIIGTLVSVSRHDRRKLG